MVSVRFNFHFDFYYRDPWEYVLSLVCDKSLASDSAWNSVRKIYCSGGPEHTEDCIIDEPNTADTWWNVDSSLPSDGPFPHSYLPLHFWLDKGLVTKRVKVYPMILRAAWLPRKIRNASGNGGGILLGYMPMVNPGDPDERGAAETLEFSEFKREVYQRVLGQIFNSLKWPSQHGETHMCNDNVIRILYPGILIESQDGEEASYFCACRATIANHPCPKCLVHQSQLGNITEQFELRTPETMCSVLQQASHSQSKTAKEKILRDHGLHNIKHFLWDFRFSDPYAASSYDTLHSDDLGKWGKHLWVLLTGVLRDKKCLGKLSRNMNKFPYWKDLKHMDAVSTISFADGQCFYDILKCILPCIVQLLPRNSPLIHCIRAYQQYRVMIGLRCMTDQHLGHLKEIIKDYENYCNEISSLYEKNFNFPKQHYVSHIISDIRQKGTTDNMSTRPGEGFQQEASQAYRQTNRKKIDKQMTKIDANLEAIAAIRMAITKFDESITTELSVHEEHTKDAQSMSEQHWAFGSRISGRQLESREVEQKFAPTDSDFTSFDDRLRSFIACNFPDEDLRYEDLIYASTFQIYIVQMFKCLYVTYQSMEDWTESRDILQCNSSFNNRERYDCVIVNSDSSRIDIARLRSLLRCRLLSGKTIDIALVHTFHQHTWKPFTLWDNCQILNEDRDSSFLLLDFVVRGGLMCPAFDNSLSLSSLHYIVDTVDGDMFLRVNNLT
ncbi:hypothetical protein BDQ17DRAFT_1392381 [Cyathus striatus]|nr:hypothetical protein BDQ17DRAFT_1392381 [Cyathus striatus]